MRNFNKLLVEVLVIPVLTISLAQARVSHLSIHHQDTILEGKIWGDAGAYELIQGTIYFLFDPDNAANLQIADIQYAAKNSQGLVEAHADFEVLRPLDPTKAKTAVVEVSNRGGKFSLNYFLQGQGRILSVDNPEPFGDGYFLNQGITFIWIGWQFDVPETPDLLNFYTTTAKYPEGTPIIGLVRSDWVVDEPTNNLKLGHRAQIGYPPYEPDSDIHVLTYRSGRDSTRHRVERTKWQFGKKTDGELDQNERWIYSEEGFQPGYIYELVYHSVDPPVVGLGMAAIRDIISYAKYDDTCPFPVTHGIAAGVSQTGRFLRTFLYQNFNVDEGGRQAYDGMMIMTAGAGRGSFNHRFAQPSRDAHRYSAFFYPTDIFPFTSSEQTDLATGVTDGLLSQTSLPPRVFYINTGYEYYGRAASLIHTSIDGKSDWSLPPNERIYHLASAQHFVSPAPDEQAAPEVVFKGNPLNFKPNFRALLQCLIQWTESDLAPPASQYPKLSNQELVPVTDVSYPSIPGFNPAKVAHIAYRADYGLKWPEGIISKQPPDLGDPFPSLVPQVDVLGNELGGIRNVEILVPLATYVSYSLRENMAGGNGEIDNFRGLFIPFALKERQPGDNRKSVTELYPSKNDYMLKVANALEVLIDNRFILHHDRIELIEAASGRWNWINRSEAKISSGIPVMTFNIRYDNPADGEHSWAARRNHVTEIIKDYDPAFLGLQEALEHQCEELANSLTGYRWIGVGREDGKSEGEYVPIFYKHKVWKLLDHGHFWLSESPDRPSQGWDAALPRMVTWGKFRARKSNREFFVFNTHFDHRGEQARTESARLIKIQIAAIAGDKPIVLMGDFNAIPTSDAYRELTQFDMMRTLADGRLFSSTEPKGPRGTSSSFEIQEEYSKEPIDYIFCSPNVLVNSFEVITRSWNRKYASDHFAVFARVDF
ncbi:MAG: endonuclease/exonuclease/phosphatase family protein [Saprospiraceae bacterium]|nr:endonuclease/exonuclease/phosphatase family protein [Saprospiraceae bacterium]